MAKETPQNKKSTDGFVKFKSLPVAPIKMVPQEEFEKHKQWLNRIIVAILIVMGLAFVAFLIDAWRFHTVTVDSYERTLKEIHTKYEKERSDNLEKRIIILENQAKENQLSPTR